VIFITLGGIIFMDKNNLEITIENDVYFMQAVQDKIIINYGYGGIEILDCNLKSIKKINIFDDIVIHSTYVNSKSNELLLYCPENGCFVYVNLNDYSTKTILIEDDLENAFFSTIYLWQEDVIIINLYCMSFVKIDLKKECIEIIEDKKVMEMYPVFYKFCSCISNEGMIDICSGNNGAVLQDSSGELFICGVEGNFNKLNIKNTYGITDCIFNGSNIGLVYQNYVKVIGNNNEKSINCEKGDVFLKAAYLENKSLAVLSSSRIKPMQSKVLIFNI